MSAGVAARVHSREDDAARWNRGVAMKPYSLDEHWEVLTAEYHAAGRRVPWLDRLWYRAALAWLRWRRRRAI